MIKSAGVLFIHSFTGAPFEMMEWRKFFDSKGIKTKTVKLPGHGSSPKDLDKFNKSVCLFYIEAVLDKFKTDNPKSKIFLIGHSFGGTIALDIASQNGNIAGVIVTAPPVYFNFFREWGLRSFYLFSKFSDFKFNLDRFEDEDSFKKNALWLFLPKDLLIKP